VHILIILLSFNLKWNFYFQDEAEPETKEDKVPAIWTSGRLCDFSGQQSLKVKDI
jgi:hypothetical protein